MTLQRKAFRMFPRKFPWLMPAFLLGTALPFRAGADCFSTPAGLVSWWPGDGTANDIASTNNGLLQGGATANAPGMIGLAFGFDGTNSFVQIPNAPSLQPTNLTVEAWVLFNSLDSVGSGGSPAGDQYIVFKQNTRDSDFEGFDLSKTRVGANDVFRFLISSATAQKAEVHSVTTISTNTWYYVTAVRGSNFMQLYVNGVLEQQTNITFAQNYGNFPLYFGTSGESYWDHKLSGILDEVSLYNRALSSTEVAFIYAAGSSGKCKAPNITTQPQPATVLAGTNVTFTVAATGFGLLGYQWLFNGTNLPGADATSLFLTNVLPDQSGDYSVVVANSLGSATSSVASLAVFIPPSFIIQPANQTWIAGSNATLVSLATGSQPISYQWYANGVPLTDNGHYTGTATSTLSVSNVLTSDAATYDVIASNFVSSVPSFSAITTVVVPPAITIQPRGWSIPFGFPVAFTGGASGTAPLGFQWLLNGSPVASGTGPTLTISNTASSNYGNYQLVATNAGGAATSSVAPLTLGNVGTWGTFSQVANSPIWPPPGLSNVVAISAGNSYSLAVRNDGTVVEWGSNISVTNLPANLTGIVGVAAGLNHALALHSNGTVTGWGQNDVNQATPPPGLKNVIAISAGSAFSTALRSDGTVVSWGFGMATNIPPGLFNVKAIDAGGSQMIALRQDGTAVSWGGSPPVPVPAGLGPIMGVATDMAVGSNGLVSVWAAPTNAPPGLSGVAAVAAGGDVDSPAFDMAMRSNGTVVVWETPFAGAAFPITNVPPGVSNTVAISAGESHALALLDDGRPLIIGPPIGGTFYSGRDLVLNAKAVGNAPLSYLWLKNGNPVPIGTNVTLDVPSARLTDAGTYQLVVSNAVGVAQSVPVPVTVANSPPILDTQPQGGFAYYGSPFSVGAALIGSGPLTMQWLQNGLPGASGTNNLVFDRALPQQAGTYQLIASNPFGAVTSGVANVTFSRVATWGTGPPLTNAPINLGTVTAVALGYSHALAINSDTTVSAWATGATPATNVPAGLSNVIAVAAGNQSSVALKSDGTVSVWGAIANRPPPGVSNVVAVAVGATQELALLSNGTVIGWGNGLSATPPAGLSNVVAISAGSVQSLALKSDGTIVGWGQFGKIPPTTNVVAIAAGFGQSLALQADGTVVAWSTTGAATQLPANLNNVVAISVGGGAGYGTEGLFHCVALKADGSLVAWGDNSEGQLYIPAGIASTVALSAGGSSTFAYLNDRSPWITAQPFDRHVPSGTNITLAALAVGQPPLNYQWLFKGTNIPGANGPTLNLTGVNRASRGDYYAVVSNGLGTNNSRDLQLAVGGPVRLLQPSVTGAGGSGGAFSVLLQDSFGGSLTPGDLTSFTMLTSSNLVDWLPLTTTLTYTNGSFLLQDPRPPNQPERFYQVVEP